MREHEAAKGPSQVVAADYDVIVCGAGTAGCVVAARLAAHPNVSVLLLEAGGSDDTELISDPDRWPQALGSDLDWNDATEPNPRLEGRSVPCNMGRVLGGGSSINVCTWSRAHRADWDRFAAEAHDDVWNHAAVSDIHRNKIENWAGEPDPDHRSSGGAAPIRGAQDRRPFSSAFLLGASSLGLPRFANANGQMMESERGCSFVDETIADGRRQSIYRSYVGPLLDRPNLTVLTRANVTRLLFDQRRATSVVFEHECREVTVS